MPAVSWAKSLIWCGDRRAEQLVQPALGGHSTCSSFNEETRREWAAWLKLKYETVDQLNDLMGTRFWAQTVTRFDQVPMPRPARRPSS